jgi:hypothetical protein
MLIFGAASLSPKQALGGAQRGIRLVGRAGIVRAMNPDLP